MLDEGPRSQEVEEEQVDCAAEPRDGAVERDLDLLAAAVDSSAASSVVASSSAGEGLVEVQAPEVGASHLSQLWPPT